MTACEQVDRTMGKKNQADRRHRRTNIRTGSERAVKGLIRFSIKTQKLEVVFLTCVPVNSP